MSRRRDALSWGLVGVVLLLVGVASMYVLWPQLQPHVDLKLGDGVYKAQVAKTQEARDKNLTGVSGLAEDQAMLLVYGGDGKWTVTTQNTAFPVDIVWLNKDKQVVYIVKNAPPESYPYDSYVSKDDARYVVELAAGTVGKKAISIGTTAIFDENNMKGLQL